MKILLGQEPLDSKLFVQSALLQEESIPKQFTCNAFQPNNADLWPVSPHTFSQLEALSEVRNTNLRRTKLFGI
jgi:hypothetical protein